MKKILLGGLSGGIAYFLIGYVIYGILLMGFVTSHPGLTSGFVRNVPLFPYLILGNFLAAFGLAYIFTKANVDTFSKGMVAGGIIGLLFSGSHDFVSYATTTLFSRTGILADVGGYAVLSAIVGGIIAIVIGKIK